MAGKMPAFQFYPDDWLSDEKLRSCSSAAIGLWIDMLCLMHKNDRRGHLQLNGKPVTAAQLARMTGRATDEVSRQLQELVSAGVPSATESGILYSRRMVRDEKKRKLCSQAGKKGGGNPVLRTYKGVSKGASKGPLKGGYGDGEGDEDSSSGEGKEGGVGGEGGGVRAEFALTPEGLAQHWCFNCARRKLGAVADQERDVSEYFREMLRVGYKAADLLDAMNDPKRNRNEYLWEFKKRIGEGAGDASQRNGSQANARGGVGSPARVRAEPGKYANLPTIRAGGAAAEQGPGPAAGDAPRPPEHR